jgi:AcrR family transcriptional regulator
VAHALGVSHGAVYRHFPSKAALRDAVVERWLARVSSPLQAAEEKGPCLDRLRRWLELLIRTKRKKAREDPELFATYVTLAAQSRGVVTAHVEHLVEELTRIITDGVEQSEFDVTDPADAARAVLDSMSRFHNPAHAAQWSDPGINEAFEGVWDLVARGLGARASTHRGRRVSPVRSR